MLLRIVSEFLDVASVKVATALFEVIESGAPTTVRFPMLGDDGVLTAMVPALREIGSR